MNDVKQDGDDLFELDSDEQENDDIDQLDVSINASTNEDPFVEESNPDKNLTPAEIKREEMIASTILKLKLGEVTLEDVAAKQRWLAQESVKRMTALDKTSQPTLDQDLIKKLVREEAEKVNAEKAEEAHVKALVSAINGLSLPSATLKVMNETFKAYKARLGAKEAIELAIERAGVDLEEIQVKRERFGVFKPGGKVQESSKDDFDPNNMSADERYAQAKKRGLR